MRKSGGTDAAIDGVSSRLGLEGPGGQSPLDPPQDDPCRARGPSPRHLRARASDTPLARLMQHGCALKNKAPRRVDQLGSLAWRTDGRSARGALYPAGEASQRAHTLGTAAALDGASRTEKLNFFSPASRDFVQRLPLAPPPSIRGTQKVNPACRG